MNRRIAVQVAGLFCLGLTPAFAQPQIVKEDVSFRTTDGVLLKGAFYPSKKGGASPAVILLHKLGESRVKGDWETLAGKLQEKGYAVLSFDFRGHGASTQIVDQNTFWSTHANNTFLKYPNPNKKKLEWKDFRIGYIPYLVNDIAAARHDLDNRNDNGQCNTSNLIVIGAEDGASLGMFWILTEFYRPQVYQKLNILNINNGALNNSPAGDDFAGAIWLSYKRHPGFQAGSGAVMPYGVWMSKSVQQPIAPIVAVRDRIPMWLAAGAKDATGIADANYIYNTVLNADNPKIKLPLTSKLNVENTPLRGVNLLGLESLKVDELIDKFIDKAVQLRPNQAQRKRNAGDFLPTWIEPDGFGFGR